MTYSIKTVADCSTGVTQDVPLIAAEIAFLEANDAALAALPPTNGIKAQIAALEAQVTPRMLRETQLSPQPIDPSTGLTASQTIIQINNQIMTLRQQLSSGS